MKILATLGFGLSTLLMSTASSALTVDFSTFTQANYSGNSDFTVTSYGGPETDVNLNPHVVGGRLVNSTDPSDVSSNYPTENIINFDFSAGLDSLALDMYWAGNPGAPTVTTFDIAGNMLEQFGYVAGSNALYNFDSTDLIYSLQTNTNVGATNDWWYGVNSISYEIGAVSAVPEPATFALMLGGLGLVGFMARRRKQA